MVVGLLAVFVFYGVGGMLTDLLQSQRIGLLGGGGWMQMYYSLSKFVYWGGSLLLGNITLLGALSFFLYILNVISCLRCTVTLYPIRSPDVYAKVPVDFAS